jgi:Zn-dependent hydrolases, including glyoxylases
MAGGIERIIAGPWKVNVYRVLAGQDAWIIDPGDDYASIKAAFLGDGINLCGLFCTHGHFDHISAVAAIKEDYPVACYLGANDRRLANQINLYRKLAGADTFVAVPKIDFELDSLDGLPVGNAILHIRPAPGHTPGSHVFALGDCVFSGDLFYKRGIGRTDNPGGDADVIRQSVERIITEFEGYEVYPGHGEPFHLDARLIDEIRSEIRAH